ncbi:MAG: PAS domain-containing hybrid sensor histidine kinase/response regulator [Nitrospirota bacterium]
MKDEAASPHNARQDPAPTGRVLSECEQALNDVQQIAQIGTWRYQIEDQQLWWSDEVYRIFGMDPGAGRLSLERLFALIHPEDREVFKTQIANRDSRRSDYRIILPDGSVKYLHEEVRVERDEQGKTVRMYGTAQDVTERKRIEEALRASEDRYRQLFDAESDAIVLIDNGTGRILMANNAASSLYGYSMEELLAKKNADLSAEPSETRRVTEETPVIKDNAVTIPLRYHRKKDGTVFPVEITGRFFQHEGRPVHIAAIRDITGRKRAEEELAGQKAMLQQILDTSSVAIFLVDKNGRITRANRSMAGMFGYTMKELEGREYVGLVHPGEREPGRKNMLALLASEIQSVDLERRYQRKDGTEFWGHLSGRRFYDIHGTELGLIGVISDITERKRAEAELQEKESTYRTLFESANDGIFIYDSTGFTDCNQRGAEMYGLPKGKIIGRSPAEFAPERQPDGRLSAEVAGEKIQAALTGVPQVFEWQPLRVDGTPFDVEITLSRTELGGKVYLQAIVRDITERKRVQEALRKSERMLQTIIDAEPECVKVLDENACLIMMNRAGLDMLQVDTLDEVKGQCVCPMVTSEYRQAFLDLTRRIYQGESGTLLFEMVGMKGRRLWLETHAVPLRNDKDVIIALLGVTRDVTEWKRTEEALRRSEGRFRSIIEHASSGILVADIETGKFRYANPQICRMLGYDADELLALDVASIHPPAELPTVRRTFAARQGALTQCLRKDGTEFPVEIRSVELELEGRQCLVGFFSDITEKLLLEEERLKAQKLESIGTLAGGIAHDFNNLLQGVFGYISMAKLTADRPEKSLAMLTQAEKALHQSVNLTSQLLTFSKGGKPVRKAIDLRPVIENAVKFALSGSRVSYDLAMDKDLSMVEADAGQISQVVQNIVLNAEQAMPLGGTIGIAARNAPASVAAGHSLPAPDGLVEIVVRDRGMGIPAEHLPRIFDPYFTTKEKGSGLGLATSYSIVKNHDGTIDVSSELGRGTTFTVYIPATRTVPAPSASSGPGTRAAGRSHRVLVMDDEPLVRAVAAELLRELGHDADFAEHGDAAIEKYKKAMAEGRPFDAVILDLTIRGGKGGAETVQELLEIDPGVKAVVSSGYSDDEIIATYRQHGFCAFLKKPYDMTDLTRVLDEVME